MSLYDATNITAAHNIYEQAVGLNQITGYSFGIMLLIVVFMITYSWLHRQTDTYGSIQGSIWITLFSAIIFIPLQLITFDIFTKILIAAGLIIFINILFKGGD